MFFLWCLICHLVGRDDVLVGCVLRMFGLDVREIG